MTPRRGAPSCPSTPRSAARASWKGAEIVPPRLHLVRGRRREAEQRRRIGWVFAGGGARGAYEIGVGSYIFDRVAREIGQPLPIDVVSGTSIGAVHASALAVWADDPQAGMKHLVARWTALSL